VPYGKSTKDYYGLNEKFFIFRTADCGKFHQKFLKQLLPNEIKPWVYSEKLQLVRLVSPQQ